MATFDALPEGSPVLLTLPILVYGIFTRHPDQTYPLSPECSVLLENCRVGRFQGVITTAIATRCWTVLQKLESRVDDLETDPKEDDWMAERMLSKPVTTHPMPKRIAALLGGQLRIATVETQDFDLAADLVQDLRISADLALDIAAASREFKIKPLNVALPRVEPWPAHKVCIPYWCQDLPWQGRELKPRSGVPKAEDLTLKANKLVYSFSKDPIPDLPHALSPTTGKEGLRFCEIMDMHARSVGLSGCKRADMARESLGRSDGSFWSTSPAKLSMFFEGLAKVECGCHEMDSYKLLVREG